MQCISFDIITAPDLASGCHLYGLKGLDPHAISNAMFYKQRQQSGDEQLPLHLQRLVAVSLVVTEAGALSFIQLQNDDEGALLAELFAILDSESCRLYWHSPQTLALLQLRALSLGVVLPQDWPLLKSEERRALQCGWFDVCQILQMDGGENRLAEMASLLALPANLGIATGQCREIESDEQMHTLQQGCLVNALHLYLLYLRSALIQGVLLESEYHEMLISVDGHLKNSDSPTLQHYSESFHSESGWVKLK